MKMVGRKDDEWPPGNGSPKTGSSTVMALDPRSASCEAAAAITAAAPPHSGSKILMGKTR